MVLLIDNYDSFVYNLARYFHRLQVDTRVVRNDAVDATLIERCKPAAVAISPGPGTPEKAGRCLEVVGHCWGRYPLLGICLGHQAIAQARGGRVVRAREPMHGRTSEVLHDGRGIFAGLASPLVACRYHSLVVEEATLPGELEVSARTADGVVMGIRGRGIPVVGLQFHPESVLTDCGYALLAGFLQMTGWEPLERMPTLDSERRRAPAPVATPPRGPLTF